MRGLTPQELAALIAIEYSSHNPLTFTYSPTLQPTPGELAIVDRGLAVPVRWIDDRHEYLDFEMTEAGRLALRLHRALCG